MWIRNDLCHSGLVSRYIRVFSLPLTVSSKVSCTIYTHTRTSRSRIGHDSIIEPNIDLILVPYMSHSGKYFNGVVTKSLLLLFLFPADEYMSQSGTTYWWSTSSYHHHENTEGGIVFLPIDSDDEPIHLIPAEEPNR